MKTHSGISVCTLWLCLAAGSPCSAVAEPQGKSRATLAPRETALQLVLDKGSVEFVAVGWPSALRIRGKGEELTGSLAVTERGIEGEVVFSLDCLDTGIALRNRHMREEYLETARFPRAVFRPTTVAVKQLTRTSTFDGEQVPFEGELELHGVTRPVHGLARVTREASRVKVDATFEVRTLDFQIPIPRYMGITVAEDVKVTVHFAGHVDTHDPETQP